MQVYTGKGVGQKLLEGGEPGLALRIGNQDGQILSKLAQYLTTGPTWHGPWFGHYGKGIERALPFGYGLPDRQRSAQTVRPEEAFSTLQPV